MQNEENNLQSRRDFFRRAARGILPILGAAALASTPLSAMASQTPTGCNSNCKLACATNCYTGCEGGCCDHCAKSCSESCTNGCYGGCKNGQNVNI